MGYVDKTLECVECGTTFTFDASEQEFYANKGFTNEPKRCPTCRQARKSRGSSGGYGGGYGGRQREMHTATCASCGKDAQVPFQPREGRPVYCSDCYAKSRR
ncbi:MAG: zinc-binding protein [Chloroflexi bacterium]|nr:zinc-binding protein [Chloroflexota bacterium]MBM3155235.1 zinc-binding protein [Chloroflexota bacterium]MBM3173050.1 zinc-binding protein [Chloroflexota bacterium]MBM3175733.1 zinc-binding protein [Chloroflexota bacterium]MBM4450491.1 zinc-binding protein [Chloroflexota bacterium]